MHESWLINKQTRCSVDLSLHTSNNPFGYLEYIEHLKNLVIAIQLALSLDTSNAFTFNDNVKILRSCSYFF